MDPITFYNIAFPTWELYPISCPTKPFNLSNYPVYDLVAAWNLWKDTHIVTTAPPMYVSTFPIGIIIYVVIEWFGRFTDSAENWQMAIQDPASPALEGMITFHEYLIFFLIQIGACVCWYLVFGKKRAGASKFTHESFLEIVWTIAPAFLLFFIAVPSFALLYSLDEGANPHLTLKVVAHQWYWSYECSDYYVAKDKSLYTVDLAFDSYLISAADLIEGAFRLLEVDNRLVVPINTHIRVLICSSDVLHSWAVPALGIKLDACPGRVSETSLFIKRPGVYYGQCSEICGANHGLMPIVVQAVPGEGFLAWIKNKASGVSRIISIRSNSV